MDETVVEGADEETMASGTGKLHEVSQDARDTEAPTENKAQNQSNVDNNAEISDGDRKDGPADDYPSNDMHGASEFDLPLRGGSNGGKVQFSLRRVDGLCETFNLRTDGSGGMSKDSTGDERQGRNETLKLVFPSQLVGSTKSEGEGTVRQVKRPIALDSSYHGSYRRALGSDPHHLLVKRVQVAPSKYV